MRSAIAVVDQGIARVHHAVVQGLLERIERQVGAKRVRHQPTMRRAPEALPRIDIKHRLPEDERTCSHHAVELERFGEVVSEQLDIVPMLVRVLRHGRPRILVIVRGVEDRDKSGRTGVSADPLMQRPKESFHTIVIGRSGVSALDDATCRAVTRKEPLPPSPNPCANSVHRNRFLQTVTTHSELAAGQAAITAQARDPQLGRSPAHSCQHGSSRSPNGPRRVGPVVLVALDFDATSSIGYASAQRVRLIPFCSCCHWE